MQDPIYDVLVVGAGPVGLSLGIELGMHGHSCLLVEQNERGGVSPRAKTTNVRSKELMRRWGVSDRLKAASPFGVDYAGDVVFAVGLQGPEITRFRNAFHTGTARDPRFAEHAQWIPQYKVEQVLRERVHELPAVELMRETRFVSLVQEDECVLATLETGDSRRRWTVRARYLVGADGARSTVREQLDISMQGISPRGHHCNIIFRAPGLAAQHPLGAALMYWLVSPALPCVLAPLDVGDLWTFGCARSQVGDDVQGMIRRATGYDGVIEILKLDDWVAHELIAQRYRVGRAFLAGDACHLHPPFGGHGMNMGIGDAVDLGWKIHAVLSGWGGESLLDSYEVERGQVHRRVIDESVANHEHLPASFHEDGLEAPGEPGQHLRAAVAQRIQQAKIAEFDSLALVLGSRYERSPVIVREPADGTPPANEHGYVPSAWPGSRSPHLWLRTEQGEQSLFDFYDFHRFTLLCAADEEARVADALGPEAAHVAVLALPAAQLEQAFGAPLVLVRPDQYVAWRGQNLASLPQIVQACRGLTAAA